MPKYKHSAVFAEIKSIEEDIKVNLTSLQYLQLLDYYLWNSLYFVIKISPKFFDRFLGQVIAYQQVHAMSKVSSESREKISCLFFNYLSTHDLDTVKSLYLNRGLYFGLLSYWLNQSKLYFQARSVFNTSNVHPDASNVLHTLMIENEQLFYAHYKQAEYWFNKALDFKSKIMQKYVRMTLLQAQKTYVDFNHQMDLDDVTQIYLQIMSKAIDRCDSRFGVLTTFIQSWLKSARATVQRVIESKQHCDSYEGLIEEFGDSLDLGSEDNAASAFETVQELAYCAQQIDKSGVLRIMYNIPQYISVSDRKLLEEACLTVNPSAVNLLKS